LAAAADYDAKKRSFLDTERLCQTQGVTFLPMVMETTGAWSQEAAKVLFLIAKAVGVRTGRTAKEELQLILQASAVCVRRANARACLRRRGAGELDVC
jgi:3-deoxy-D-arabino-heptulosonate 7-phosphate (DAHP) synthase